RHQPAEPLEAGESVVTVVRWLGNSAPAITPGSGPLLTQRAAMVFLLAALAGIGATVLAALAGNAWPVAVSVGSGTSATAVLFFREIID
ncbi:hypothetical protein ABZ299_31160, partial [Streptomyces sp. NPDC006184]|uniref:hypothetical protein n=1 Tax=Streptomyces sp. NPDC006184 TaxID=3155455 RepID=UPI00339E3C29